MTCVFFADPQRFPHETIDGETVIIDAESGRLFLATGVGPWLWNKLTSGASFEALVDDMTAQYGPDAASPTLDFLLSLKELGLLGSAPGAAATVLEAPALPDLFAAPLIEKYDDIADIIAMDPIHDIEPSKGWPHRPPDEPSV
jgi:hypothetical protein